MGCFLNIHKVGHPCMTEALHLSPRLLSYSITMYLYTTIKYKLEIQKYLYNNYNYPLPSSNFYKRENTKNANSWFGRAFSGNFLRLLFGEKSNMILYPAVNFFNLSPFTQIWNPLLDGQNIQSWELRFKQTCNKINTRKGRKGE